MKTGTVGRRDTTALDAVLGVSTLIVGIGDAVLLVLMLAEGARSPGWESATELARYSTFLVVFLLLGLLASVGIVLRSMGAGGGLASKWPPLAFVGARLGIFVLVVALFAANGTAWLEWDGWGSMVLAMGYLQPTTLLLLILSLVNLRPRGESQTLND